jgi:hypothetical protein
VAGKVAREDPGQASHPTVGRRIGDAFGSRSGASGERSAAGRSLESPDRLAQSGVVRSGHESEALAARASDAGGRARFEGNPRLGCLAVTPLDDGPTFSLDENVRDVSPLDDERIEPSRHLNFVELHPAPDYV